MRLPGDLVLRSRGPERMKRIEVWIDCETKDEKNVRKKVEDALDRSGVDYTMLANSVEIIKKGSQK